MTGDWRQDMGDWRWETGEERKEMGDRRRRRKKIDRRGFSGVISEKFNTHNLNLVGEFINF